MNRFFKLFFVLVLMLSLIVPTGLAKEVEKKQEYLVQFNDSIDMGLLSNLGIQEDAVLHKYDLLPVLLLELTGKEATALKDDARILAVEENAEVHAAQTAHVGVTALPSTQVTPWGVARVQAPTAHTNGYTGAGFKVAVLDTGIHAAHPDLNVVGGYSVFTDTANNNPFVDPNGHGTHMAGTIAGLNNTIGVRGVAPGAQLYAVKVLNNSGSGSFAGIAQGIEWAMNNNIRIINIGLVGSANSSILENMCNVASNSGFLLVAAAGGYPAAYNSVMSVGATTSSNTITGPQGDLAAPGVSIYSTFSPNTYATLNGTPMASAHVAGVAALVWQAKPHLSKGQLSNLLYNTAELLPSGARLVQAWNAIIAP